ncbi:hypothetical protein NL317_30055, partial [Klebsiella pneumoniae]|nr:hypothetical protein [Klebsiella pneumoniae]
RLQRERDSLPAGSPRRAELDAAIRAKAVSPGGEGVYDRTTAEAYAKTDIGLQNDASGSGQRIAMLDNIEGLIRSGKAITGPGS